MAVFVGKIRENYLKKANLREQMAGFVHLINRSRN
jgi:hypothetical protein